MVKIYPIQTGTVRVKQFQLTGASLNLSRFYQLLFTQRWSEWMPIYCWLIDIEGDLILVDTGETARIYSEGYLPKGGIYHKAVQTRILDEEELPHQLAAIGYNINQVKKVILTHMHGDHIGGLQHIGHAEIFVSRKEYEFAMSKKGPGSGYFKQNWPSWFNPTLIDYQKDEQQDWDGAYVLPGYSMLTIVPTPGHSIGHQSVIIEDVDKTYVIGGDLTYNLDTLRDEIPNVVLLNKEAKKSVKQVKDFILKHNAIYLSSHDWGVVELLA